MKRLTSKEEEVDCRPTPSICTVSSNQISLIATGTCTINANQAGDDNYLVASQESRTFTITTGVSSATLTFTTGTNLIFNRASTIQAATNSVAGKVHFKANGKTIPGCKARPANAGNSFRASCIYKPIQRSAVSITAILTPNSNLYGASTVSSATYQVSRRG